MRVPRLLAAMICVSTLVPPGVHAARLRYEIEDRVGSIVIHVGKSGVLKVAGHEHEITATGWSGRLELDADHPEQGTILLTFPARGLHVNAEKEPGDDAPKVQQTMLGPRCLDADRFPAITFESSQVAIDSSANGTLAVRITGELSLHGVRRPISFPATVTLQDSTVIARGRFGIRQSDFNIKPISAGAGAVKVKNEVSLSFEITAKASG